MMYCMVVGSLYSLRSIINHNFKDELPENMSSCRYSIT